MYVSIVCSFNSEDSRKKVDNLLQEYGFKICQKDLYENNSIGNNHLSRLKLELDRQCDSYDRIRVYQYPLNHSLVISHLYNKKWKKKIISDKAIKRGN